MDSLKIMNTAGVYFSQAITLPDEAIDRRVEFLTKLRKIRGHMMSSFNVPKIKQI